MSPQKTGIMLLQRSLKLRHTIRPRDTPVVHETWVFDNSMSARPIKINEADISIPRNPRPEIQGIADMCTVC